MEIRELFCWSCGRNVRLSAMPGPELHGQATLPDGGEAVCLDYDTGCSRGVCPLTGRPASVMAYRLARSHLADDRWDRIHAECPACGAETELERLNSRHVFCTICETASMLSERH